MILNPSVSKFNMFWAQHVLQHSKCVLKVDTIHYFVLVKQIVPRKKYLFKVNIEDIKTMSTNVILVSFLLRYLYL